MWDSKGFGGFEGLKVCEIQRILEELEGLKGCEIQRGFGGFGGFEGL